MKLLLKSTGIFKKIRKPKKGAVKTFSNKKQVLEAFDKLGVKAKDDIRGQLLDLAIKGKINGFGKFKSFVNKALIKKDSGKPLTSQEKKAINQYDKLLNKEEGVERVNVNSKWIIWAEYHKKTKVVYMSMKRGKIIYPFFNVPRTKWLMLVTSGGTYMWDYFGKHYSARPYNWIRKGDR